MQNATSGTLIDKSLTSLQVIGNTPSTSPQTGALTVRGGVGISENLNVSGDVVINGTLEIPGNVEVGLISIGGESEPNYVLTATDTSGNTQWRANWVSITGKLYYNDNVSIGTTATTELFTVNGNMFFDGLLKVPDTLSVLGNLSISGILKDDFGAYILPGVTDVLTGISSTQTLSNKTIIAPTISGNMNFASSGKIINLNTPTNEGDATNKAYVDSLINGLDWQDSVLSNTVDIPPVSPTTGDRYIIPIGATGVWSTHINKITEWNGSSWTFIVPNDGYASFVEDIDKQYNYNGSSWVLFGSLVHHDSLSGLLNDDHLQYAHLPGRIGGQQFYGGTAASNNLIIESTSHVTKGIVSIQPKGGNVGIGITSSLYQLHLNENLANSLQFVIEQNNLSGQAGIRLHHKTDTFGTGLHIQHDAVGNVKFTQTSTAGDVYFYNKGTQSDYKFYNTNSDLERFSILTNGNVTINNNLSFIDGSNQILYTDTLSFNTNSTDIIYLGSTSVGIGTNTPLQKFHVNGVALLDAGATELLVNTSQIKMDFTGSNLFFEKGSSSDTKIYNNSGGYVSIGTGTSSEHLYVMASGNVGIGNNNPQDKLDVTGNIRVSGTINQASNVFTLPSTSTDTLVARTSTDTLSNKSLQDNSVSFVDQTDATKKLDFALEGASPNSRMTLASNHTTDRIITIPNITDTLVTLTAGQVLTNKTLTAPIISTISNTGTLTLPTSTDTLVGRNTEDTLTNKTIASPSFTGNLSLANATYMSTDQVRARDADGLLLTDDSNLGIFIQDGGNVGIGSLTPVSKLDIDGNVKINDYDLFVEKSTSRVGINTSTPSTDLDVNGSAYIANNLTINGNFLVNGTMSTVNTENLNISDPLVKYAHGNTADTLDIGFFGMYIDGGVTKYSGFFRDVSTGTKPYRLFKDLQEHPITTVNTSGTGYDKGDLYLGDLEADFVTIGTFAASYPLLINKTVTNNWSQRINNNETTVYIGHSDGLGMNISTGTLTDSSYIVKFGNNNTSDAFRVQNNGLVGIRTSAPSEILDVFCSNVGEGARIGNAKIGVWEGGANYTAFTHDTVHSTSTSYAVKQLNTGETYINTAETKQLHFRNNDVDYMVMDASGNIGIGTLTPQRKLHVEGGTLVTVDLEVYGNLNILGQINAISAETIEVKDPMFKLASGNTVDVLDTGFYMQYGISNGATGGIRYAGIIRDNDDGEFKIFHNLEIEPGTTQVNTADPSFQYASFGVGQLNIEAGTTQGSLNLKYSDNGSAFMNFIEGGVTRNRMWATDDKLYFDTGGEIVYRRLSDQVELFSVDQNGLNVAGIFTVDELGVSSQLTSHGNTVFQGLVYSENTMIANNISVTGSLAINNGGTFSLADNSGSPTFQVVTDSLNRRDTMIVNNQASSSNPGFTCGTVRTDGMAFQVVNNVALTNGLPSSDGTQLIVVQGDGNVGIGTNAPTLGKLVVNNTTSNNILAIHGGADTYESSIFLGGTSNQYVKSAIIAKPSNTWSRNDLLFCMNNTADTSNVTSTNEVMRIRHNGNVGIGTTNPDNELHIFNSTAQSNVDGNDFLPTTFSQDLIIERQQSTTIDAIYGRQSSSIDFRATDGTDKWSCGSIVGLVDPFGGSSYDGGLAFYTSPGGIVDHNDSRTKGGLLVPALTLGHDQRAFFNGIVGIGTSNPLYNLHIAGSGGKTLAIQSSDNHSQIELISGTDQLSFIDFTETGVDRNGRILYNNSTNTFSFFVNQTTEFMTVLSSGNVGIGTVTPINPLHVHRNNATTFLANTDQTDTGRSLSVFNTNTTTNAFACLSLRTSGALCDIKMVHTGSNIGKLVHTMRNNSTWHDVMTLDAANSGRVGIGTTSPSQQLHVQADALIAGGDLFLVDTNEKIASDGTDLFFHVNGAETVRFKSGGFVGIGTNNPGFILDILAPSTQHAYININRVTTANDSGIRFRDNGTDEWVMYSRGSDNAFLINEGTSNTRMFFQPTTGNIGIGTTNPSSKLEINGNCTATQFITLSDMQAKENIRTLSPEKCMETVKNINLYEFDYKDNKHSSIGVIAQEIEEMFPKAVVVNENGTRYVNYQMLFILMFGCIKEMMKQS